MHEEEKEGEKKEEEQMKMKYRTCSQCGAHLDHGEGCRCHIEALKKEAFPDVRPGDIVRHIPTGDEYEAYGVNCERGLVVVDMPGGLEAWELEDCEIITKGTGEQTIEQIDRLKRCGRIAYIERS